MGHLINCDSEHFIFSIAYSLCIWCRALGCDTQGTSHQNSLVSCWQTRKKLMTYFLVQLCSKFTKTFSVFSLDGGLTDWMIKHWQAIWPGENNANWSCLLVSQHKDTQKCKSQSSKSWIRSEKVTSNNCSNSDISYASIWGYKEIN